MPSRMRGVALALALLWAAWWVFFAAGDAVVRHDFGGAVTFAVVLTVTVAVAWKWTGVGGVLLVVESMASIARWAPMWIRRFDFWQVVLMFAIMPLPPLVAGVLLLLSGHRHTPPPPVHAA